MLYTFYFQTRSTKMPKLAWNFPSSYLGLLSSWDHKPVPPRLAHISLITRKGMTGKQNTEKVGTIPESGTEYLS